MINKVESSTTLYSTEQKQTAATSENAWEQYAREIEELKTNPPKMYAVTIPLFTMGGTSFPTWQIPDFTKAGFDPKTIPAAYEKRIIVSEKYLQCLQKEVPGFLRDIVEVDPSTGQPLPAPHSTSAATASLAQTLSSSPLSSPSTVATTKDSTPPQPTPAQPISTRRATASTTIKDVRPRTQQEQHVVAEASVFDFTKLLPEVQQTGVQLAQQLLTTALQRLSDSSQLGADVSALLNHTA